MLIKFADRVYKILREVPIGSVTTYKAIAQKLGCKAYRAVGQVLRNNPYAPEVPCHRVVKSDGRVGGFTGKTIGKEIEKKIELLKSEGVKISGGKVIDFEKILLFVILFLCSF